MKRCVESLLPVTCWRLGSGGGGGGGGDQNAPSPESSYSLRVFVSGAGNIVHCSAIVITALLRLNLRHRYKSPNNIGVFSAGSSRRRLQNSEEPPAGRTRHAKTMSNQSHLPLQLPRDTPNKDTKIASNCPKGSATWDSREYFLYCNHQVLCGVYRWWWRW